MAAKLKLHTFCVILSLSVMNKKQWAKCSPVWHPGIWWNPTRSDLRQSFLGLSRDSWWLVASIQCAVTAIKEFWFGSDQQSFVNEILPTDFYEKWNKYPELLKKSCTFMSSSSWCRWALKVWPICMRIDVRPGISDSLSSFLRRRNILCKWGDSMTLIDCRDILVLYWSWFQ